MKRLALWIIGILFVGFSGYKIAAVIYHTNDASKESLPLSFNLPDDYGSIIRKDSADKFQVKEVYNSEVRNPVAFMIYGQAYYFVMYKFDSLEDDKSLRDLVVEKSADERVSAGYPYRVMANGVPFEFDCRAGKIDKGSQIYLTMFGDSLREFASSDSVIAYHLFCRSFAVKRESGGLVDMLFSTKNTVPEGISLDISFIKSAKEVYLLFTCAKDGMGFIDDETFYSLIGIK